MAHADARDALPSTNHPPQPGSIIPYHPMQSWPMLPAPWQEAKNKGTTESGHFQCHATSQPNQGCMLATHSPTHNSFEPHGYCNTPRMACPLPRFFISTQQAWCLFFTTGHPNSLTLHSSAAPGAWQQHCPIEKKAPHFALTPYILTCHKCQHGCRPLRSPRGGPPYIGLPTGQPPNTLLRSPIKPVRTRQKTTRGQSAAVIPKWVLSSVLS